MTRCVIILGGSFDPIHNGHVALAAYFAGRLNADEIRVIPAGHPWQKQTEITPAEHRIKMIQHAFETKQLRVIIDTQEIERSGATYTIDTLRQLREEFGSQASIVFLLGADQVQRLDTWKDWQQLFDYAHLCGASRPGYPLNVSQMPKAVAEEFSRRAGTLEQIRAASHGMTYLAHDLEVETSATDIRAALKRGETPSLQVPPAVLDYIEKFHLYKD